MKIKFKYRDGQLLSPAKVDHNIYDPNLTEAESLDVLNGHLDHKNIDLLPDEHLPLSAIRRGALFRGKMVGSTLNSDFYKKIFPWTEEGHWSEQADDDPSTIQPIPGCGIEFFAPTSGTLILTWQVSYTSDLDKVIGEDGEGNRTIYTRDGLSAEQVYGFPSNPIGYLLTGRTGGQDAKIEGSRAFLTLMGATDDEDDLSEIGFRHYFPFAINGWDESVDPMRIMGQGRVWSGHHVVQATERTWYRYAIGVLSTANMARIRVRNFKYLFFPNASANLSTISTSGL